MEDPLGPEVRAVDDGPHIERGTVRVDRDGSFEERVAIPETAETGDGEIYLTPDTLDLAGPCDHEPSDCPLIGGTSPISVGSACSPATTRPGGTGR